MSQMTDAIRDMRNDWFALNEQWHTVRQQWQDQAADRFEKGLWVPMANVWPSYLNAMEEFANTIERALSEM